MVLIIGLFYDRLTTYTGIYIPCLLYRITGIKCPGCGITGMCKCLLAGDLSGAFCYHPFLFLTGPYLLFLIVCEDVCYVMHKQEGKLVSISKYVYLVGLLGYTVARNLLL